MSNLTNFTPEEFTRVISGKAELYESALRNGYKLPSYKSDIIITPKPQNPKSVMSK